MTLKEKFIKESIDIRYQVLEPEKFEQIADDYAISFLEWYFSDDGYDLIYDLILAGELDKNTTAKKLLEIFKKEKGL
jgi:hypothetical protein